MVTVLDEIQNDQQSVIQLLEVERTSDDGRIFTRLYLAKYARTKGVVYML